MAIRKKGHKVHINHERWMVSWADFMTLLFALFVLLFAISNVDQEKLDKVAESVDEAFGVLPSHANGVLEKQYAQAENMVPPVLRTYPEPGEQKEKAEQKLTQILQKHPLLKSALATRWEERGLVIQLSESVLFESGSSELKAGALPVLKSVLRSFLLDNKNPIRIEGHTDNQPFVKNGSLSNWELSAVRATRVLQAVLSTGWIPPERLSMAGYGQYKPIASNQNPEGRAKNRRVDIVLLNPNAQTQEPLANNRLDQAILEEQLRYKMESRR